MTAILPLRDARELLSDVVDLELAASHGYAEFVYGSVPQARAINLHLLETGDCEFGEPHAVVALSADAVPGDLSRRPLGYLCGVPGSELASLRLSAASRLRGHPVAQDPALAARARLARKAMLKPLPTDLYLSRIAVAPQARGRGIGGILMRHLMDRARALGAARCVLEVDPRNEVAIRLYRSHGFEVLASMTTHDPVTSRTLAYDHMAALVTVS